jgi:group II intron reverse transcriptase/maturase
LHAKAKSAPNYRFYALYDKVWRRDVLAFAYGCCFANQGVAGVDGQTFDDIEAYGGGVGAVGGRTGGSTPQADVSSASRSQRPLGIPTITDRVVQTAMLVVLEPIFEADLQPEQHAYRPGQSALDAVQKVQALLQAGHTEVVDADLSGYFDSIPHAELMKSVARRVSDGRVLGLIKAWLVAPVEEADRRGRRHRTTRNRDEGRGTPQGAPLSPLLANLYMRRFVLGWKAQGHERRLDAHIVNYADDFVICCRGTAAEAMTVMRTMMSRLRLTVNETKTRLCRVPDERFDFLGYTFGRFYSPRTGGAYVGMRPSAKKVQAIYAALGEQTERRWLFLDPGVMVGRLNRLLVGWANYFCRGAVYAVYHAVDRQACFRLRQWLGQRERVQGASRSRYSEPYLRRTYGLVKLEGRRPQRSCANA